jgi:hypothetical protein
MVSLEMGGAGWGSSRVRLLLGGGVSMSSSVCTAEPGSGEVASGGPPQSGQSSTSGDRGWNSRAQLMQKATPLFSSKTELFLAYVPFQLVANGLLAQSGIAAVRQFFH